MTPDEARELEAAVAVALGWRYVKRCGHFDWWQPSDSPHATERGWMNVPSPPRYLTDSAATWAAFVWLWTNVPTPMFVSSDPLGVEFGIDCDEDELREIHADGPTPAEAVCRAVAAAKEAGDGG